MEILTMRSLIYSALKKLGLAKTASSRGHAKSPSVRARRKIDYLFYPHVPSISLELTNLCNLKCPYCANQSLTRRKGKIRWELVEKLVDECSREHYRLDCLHGTGEPLLYDRLEDVIRLIRSRHAGLGAFATNATFLTPERVRSLLAAGLRSISISLDTLDPALYQQTRGADLAKVVSNIQRLIELAPPDFKIAICLMEHKDQHLNDAVWRKFRETFGEHPNIIPKTQINGRFPSAPADYRAVKASAPGCTAPGVFLFITHEGKAAICCADQDALCCLGDVAERSIKEIWYSRQTQSLLRNVALGLFECPAVCTQLCSLKPPEEPRTKISAGYGLPFEEAFALIKKLDAQGNHESARALAEELKGRAPWDNHALFEFLQRPWSLG